MPEKELLCRRSLALLLGALEPDTPAEVREMKRAGHLLLRDPDTGDPLFWPLVPSPSLPSSRVRWGH